MANAHRAANRPHIAATILQMTSGEDDFIIVPKVFVRLTGSLEAGIMLRKALYWHGTNKKGQPFIKRADGFFYKSDREWCEELCLTRYSVRSAAKRLQDMGIFQIKKLQANGKPTMHYRIDFNVLEQRLVEHLNLKASLSEIEQCHYTESNNDVSEIEQSITQTTTQATTQKTQASPTANAFGDAASFTSYEGNTEKDRPGPTRREHNHVDRSMPRATLRNIHTDTSCSSTAKATPEEMALMQACIEAKKLVKGEGATIQFSDKDMSAIRSLTAKGCRPQQAFGCYVWLATSQFWISKDMTPQTIAKRFGEWLKVGKPLINDDAHADVKAQCKQRLAEREARQKRKQLEAEAAKAGCTSVDAYIAGMEAERQRRATEEATAMQQRLRTRFHGRPISIEEVLEVGFE